MSRKEYNKQRKENFQKIVNEFKAAVGCRTCGENDFRCLNLVPTDSDSPRLSTLISQRKISKKGLDNELGKYEVVCENCRRKAEYKPS